MLLKNIGILFVASCLLCACTNTVSTDEPVGVDGIAGFHPGKSATDTSSTDYNSLSSMVQDGSSSSVAAENSSVSKDGEFDWSLPKTAYLNPDIEYGEMTDERDGKKYKTVQIGEQTWMAENLNYADSILTPSIKGKNWCVDNDEAKCEIVGRFYTWAAAIDSIALASDKDNPRICGHGVSCKLSDDTIRGICPEGWHVPSYRDWMDLHDAVGGEENAGKLLKSQKGWLGTHVGTDDYGFSAIPAGFPRPEKNASNWDLGERTFFICTEEWGGENKDYIHKEAFVKEDDDGHLGSDAKWNGNSLRCIKD